MEEKTRKTLTSIFSFLLGVAFTLDGIVKLVGVTSPFVIIPGADFPLWLTYVISLFELVGGIMLLIEDIRFYGGALTVLSTVVGIVYGLGAVDYLTLVMPILFFIGSWMVALSSMPEGINRIACSMPLFRMTHACKVSHHHTG
ncbi:MAG: hypothetical protein EPN93_15070 [Spirochaetes bacterium]|nr:MAG: hypothetical protein EPN93_15070 [Spirochaetota bacterium]